MPEPSPTAPLIEPKVLKRIMRVRGSTDEAEIALLHRLAAGVRRGVIVEVGSAAGRSTVALALGARRGVGAAVYAVDPHEDAVGVLGGRFTPAFRGFFFKTLLSTGTVEDIRLVNLSSEVVTPGWNREVGLLFVDGDHSYEGAKRDYSCWLPHLHSDAVVVFHDSLDVRAGVHLVVREALEAQEVEMIDVVSRDDREEALR